MQPPPPHGSTSVSSRAVRSLVGLLMTIVLVVAVLRSLRTPLPTALTSWTSPAQTRRWPTLTLALASIGGAMLWTAGGVPGLVGSVAAVAVLWFVVPLAWARWTRDEALVAHLVAERRRSLTVLLICALGRLATALCALAAGLYLLPLALIGYMSAESLSGRLVEGSSWHTNLALAASALAVLAWAAYPLAAGFCAARGGTPDGVTGRLARTVRWGGRSVTTTVAQLARHWKITLALLSTSLVALLLVGAIYALVPALAHSDAFEQFSLYHVDPDQVAIGAAAGVLVMIDMLAWGRERSGWRDPGGSVRCL